ncbi:MAG TPA: GNAT family protein [Solirubrobacterales bacterium]
MRFEISPTTHLRPFEESDAEELHALIEANRERLARWLPWAQGQTYEDTLGFIRRTIEQVAANDGFQAAIVCDGRIAGAIGYREVDWGDRSTSLGYWLAEAYEGRGTMTEAVRALTDHAFTAWGLRRVEVRAAVENRRSRAILERLGFTEEATLPRAELVGGRHLDSVVYAMLSPEAPPRPGS